jgi:DNA-binding response OmpR family regulator
LLTADKLLETLASMPKRILLADDEENLRLLVRMAIEDAGHQIVEAGDGEHALALAREHRPDLIVLDWMMPGLTGLEVTRSVRSEPDLRGIPILLITAKGQEEDRHIGMEAGATDYLVKPFSPLELAHRVEELLAV